MLRCGSAIPSRVTSPRPTQTTPVDEADIAAVAMGANLGDREASLREAASLLRAEPGVRVLAVSGFIETEPVSRIPQGPYLNAAALLRTDLAPRELLEALLRIERRCGRDRAREQRWGTRTLDLDLLVYGGTVLDEPGLTLPHPRMHERAFVLEPLAEIAPDLLVPVHNRTVRQLLDGLKAG